MEKEDIIRRAEELSKGNSLIGKKYFASFLPEASVSNVPVEFVSAFRNYRSALPIKTEPEEYFRGMIETVRHLLGVDCQNDLEAAYVICRAKAISLAKKLLEVSNEEESEALEQKTQEMFGATIHCARMIVLPSNTLLEFIPEVRKRRKAARLDRLRSLRGQIESNMENGQLRSRIILLASQRKI